MRTSDLDFEFPEELIAQTPIEPRDAARLLIVNRSKDTLTHCRFYDLGKYLDHGDLMVFNETRVLRARMFATKHPGGGRVEILLLRKRDARTWEALIGGSGVKRGSRLNIVPLSENSSLNVSVEVIEELERSQRVLRFDQPVDTLLDMLGHMPVPPYIHTQLDEPERYQTVYARVPGSAAAPTAGLHFTPELIESAREMGLGTAFVELRVGLDTFSPITADTVEQHQIHTEYCHVSDEVAGRIKRTKARSGRVIAVGTTTARTLETAARSGSVSAFEGNTDLFITPGFKFRAVDAMITNFHWPRSTLLAMVSAFAGRETILNAYRVAIAERYRLFSFGDAMLIL